jgi:opacity protein-like surface antigen
MKNVLITASLAVVATFSFAQQNRITLGVEGGISIATLSTDDNNYKDVYESRTGYAAGLAFQYNFPKVLSLRTGIMYELKGTSFPLDSASIAANPNAAQDALEQIDYLTVPLLLRATFGDKINFFVNAGPYWSLLLKRVVVLEAASSYATDEKIDLTDDTEKTDFGISAGIGASAVFNERIVISLEVRDNLGMTDIAPQTYELKTRTLLILAGVAFKFGSRENDAK